MDSVNELTGDVIEHYKLHSHSSVFTVGISGIDASGKGHVGKLLQEQLEKKGYKVANINIDPWQNPLPVRLQKKIRQKMFTKISFAGMTFLNS